MALTLLAVVACGGSSKTSTASPQEAVNQAFTGALSDGSIVSLQIGATSQALVDARSDAAAAPVNVTGTITPPSAAAIAITGTYDPSTGDFTVSGGGYTITGKYASGAITGSCTTSGGGTIDFVAMMGDASKVTRYCGKYETALHETGAFMIVVSGTKVYGLAENAGALSGTVSGSTISLNSAKGTPATGTVSGTTVSGTFQNSDGQGTWSGSTAACGA